MSDQQTGPQMVIMGPNRGGRPRVDTPQERVSFRLPADRYDQLVKAANRSEKSVSALVRQILLSQSFLSR